MSATSITQTPRVERILQEAATEASVHGHDYLGTEHLLIALANNEGGVAAAVLTELGVREQVISRTRDIMASEGYATTDGLPS